MKVLLISVNREEFPDPVFPLGMNLVAAATELAGHQTRILDLRWHAAEVPGVIASWEPSVVGLSIRNVDNLTWGQSVSYVPEIAALAQRIRKVFDGPMVLGGSGYSLFPRELLQRLEVPYGVVGEGEVAFPALLAALERGRDPAAIPGVMVRTARAASRLTRAERAPGRSPLRRELTAEYLRVGAAIGVQTKRGCPFRCTYCTYPALEGTTLRLRDPDDVVDELEELGAAGVRKAFFVDDTFNIPGEHAEAVCRRLVERNIRISWCAFAHPGQLSPRLAGWMKRAGCAGLELGTDSLADPVLDALHKGFSASQAAATSRVAADAEIPVAHYLLLGSPGETPGTLAATVQATEQLPPAAYIAMVGVRLYPGTTLATCAREEGFSGATEDLLQPTFYISPATHPDAILSLVRQHVRGKRSWIVPSLRVRSDPDLLGRIRQRRDGPTWSVLLGEKRQHATPDRA